MIEYVGAVYRPPGEAYSFLIQPTVGCSHNKCTFCGMYKAKSFRIKPLEETIGDIREAAAMYNQFEKVFLCDGDAIILPQDYLLAVLEECRKWFPRLRLISCYAGPNSTRSKSNAQLKELHEAGLGRVYLGMETGSDEILQRVNKGVNAAEMLQAGMMLRNAGIDLWVTALIGIGGVELSNEHISSTIRMVNEMQPNHLSCMNLMIVRNTPIFQDVENGIFHPINTVQSLEETRDIVSGLTVPNLHFTSDHASNYLPLKGTLPDDREKILELLHGAIHGTVPIRQNSVRGL